MGQITTKMDVGQTGYVMQSNKITAVTVSEVKVDEIATISITNNCTNADGSTTAYDEAEIWPTPDALAADLLAQYNASLPTATPTAQPAA